MDLTSLFLKIALFSVVFQPLRGAAEVLFDYSGKIFGVGKAAFAGGAILDVATDPWGIKVNRVELKNILPPADIQSSMEKQMKAERKLTGKMGDVMKESAAAAISCVRGLSEQYSIDKDFFQEHDIHIHIPEGAVPKDGPSAGITMATAVLSAVTNTPVRADIAMTGEITLRGRVLPIGGLKEKLLAAKNAGMKTVCIPTKNEKDLDEISKEIKEGLQIVLVENLEQVLKQAFVRKA